MLAHGRVIRACAPRGAHVHRGRGGAVALSQELSKRFSNVSFVIVGGGPLLDDVRSAAAMLDVDVQLLG